MVDCQQDYDFVQGFDPLCLLVVICFRVKDEHRVELAEIHEQHDLKPFPLWLDNHSDYIRKE